MENDEKKIRELRRRSDFDPMIKEKLDNIDMLNLLKIRVDTASCMIGNINHQTSNMQGEIDVLKGKLKYVQNENDMLFKKFIETKQDATTAKIFAFCALMAILINSLLSMAQ